MRTSNLLLLFSQLLIFACVAEVPENHCADGTVSVKIVPSVDSYGGELTKSSLGADETELQTWSVAAYHNGNLADYANSTDKPYMDLVIGRQYSFYAIANTPSAEDFFLDCPGEDMLYGKTESFYGAEYYPGCLPMTCQFGHYVLEGENTVSIVFKRLVAKYNVRVERDFADPYASFTVTGMKLRNSPSIIRPFQVIGGSFAISAASLAEVCDEMDCAAPSDISELNSGCSVALYSLENLQGMISNSDPWSKNTTRPATWLELTGIWETSGASAVMTYRMYLGADATADFNVERNTSYDLTVILSEEGFGRLDSSWKISRTDFSDNRQVHIEGDWTTDRIIVYDDGEPVQYILDKNIGTIDCLVSVDENDGACLEINRNGDVLEVSTVLRDCLGMPCDYLVVTSRDGAELRRVPVTVYHKLDFIDYDLGGEATDPEDVTVGQKLIFSIADMDVFESEGYPIDGLGFRFGKYSTEEILAAHCFDVNNVLAGPGEVVLECWAMDEPGDLLYLEVYDIDSGSVLTRDGTFLVRKPSMRWVEWTGTGGWEQTQNAPVQPMTLGGASRALLLQFVSPGGHTVEFNSDLLQELDFEPDLSSLNNRYLTIDPVFTTSFGDPWYPRQVYLVSVENPHPKPQTVGSFIRQYYTGLTDTGFRMPPLTATSADIHEAARLPVELRLQPIDLSVSWSGNRLIFNVDCTDSGELGIYCAHQNSNLSFSVSDAYSRLTSGVLSKDELFDEAVGYTLDYKLSDTGYIESFGRTGNDRYEYIYLSETTVLNETASGLYTHRYTFPVRGKSSDGINLWLNNSTMLQTTMHFSRHRINLEMKSNFQDLFFPIGSTERVPFNLVSCPSDIVLSIDGKRIN